MSENNNSSGGGGGGDGTATGGGVTPSGGGGSSTDAIAPGILKEVEIVGERNHTKWYSSPDMIFEFERKPQNRAFAYSEKRKQATATWDSSKGAWSIGKSGTVENARNATLRAMTENMNAGLDSAQTAHENFIRLQQEIMQRLTDTSAILSNPFLEAAKRNQTYYSQNDAIGRTNRAKTISLRDRKEQLGKEWQRLNHIPIYEKSSGKLIGYFPMPQSGRIEPIFFEEALFSFGRTIALREALHRERWIFGPFKSETKWRSQFVKRGWTSQQVSEAIKNGKKKKAVNMVNPSNGATRYVHPKTGRSVVIDDVTKELLQVGGDGFKW